MGQQARRDADEKMRAALETEARAKEAVEWAEALQA